MDYLEAKYGIDKGSHDYHPFNYWITEEDQTVDEPTDDVSSAESEIEQPKVNFQSKGSSKNETMNSTQTTLGTSIDHSKSFAREN